MADAASPRVEKTRSTSPPALGTGDIATEWWNADVAEPATDMGLSGTMGRGSLVSPTVSTCALFSDTIMLGSRAGGSWGSVCSF
jgi:hypothetical protein